MSDELVDILNEQGEKTGQTLPKSEAHAKSLRHAGAHLWLYNQRGEVLLQHRHKNKIVHPNTWDISVAGHISAGDGPVETLVREASEELNLEIEPYGFKFVGITIADLAMPGGWVHRVIDWTYILQKEVDTSTLRLQENETDDIAWIPINQFESDINNPAKAKEYPRDKYVYELAIFEIRKVLQSGKA